MPYLILHRGMKQTSIKISLLKQPIITDSSDPNGKAKEVNVGVVKQKSQDGHENLELHLR
jgi:hypothetical protein